jgi:hypothetical protein
MPPAFREDLGDSGVEDAGGEDDGEQDEEPGDLAFAELFGYGDLLCHCRTLRG